MVDRVPTSAEQIDASGASPSVHTPPPPPPTRLTRALLASRYGNWRSEPALKTGFVHKITSNPIHMDRAAPSRSTRTLHPSAEVMYSRGGAALEAGNACISIS